MNTFLNLFNKGYFLLAEGGSFQDVRSTYDRVLDEYISSFTHYAPDIGKALNGLDWLMKFYTLLMGGLVVIVLLIISFQVLADVTYVLTANTLLAMGGNSSNSAVGKAKSIFESVCSKAAHNAAANGNLMDYFKARTGDLILTILILGLVITGQFIPVALWLMKFTKSTIDVVLNQTPDVTVIANDIQNLTKEQAQKRLGEYSATVNKIANMDTSLMDVPTAVNELNSAFLGIQKLVQFQHIEIVFKVL